MTKAKNKKRRIGRIILVAFSLIIVFLLLTPVLFKNKILERVKQEVDRNTEVTLDFTDVSISWWKHFPDLSVRIDQPVVTGKDTFAGLALFRSRALGVDFNFWDVLKNSDSLRIQGIHLDQPDIRVKVLADGTANYNITKPQETEATTSAATAFRLDLQRLDCQGGTLDYQDLSLDTYFHLAHLNQDGQITYQDNKVEIGLDAQADSVTLLYGGITYLNAAGVTWQGPLLLDLDAEKYTFDANAITLNALPVDLNGWVDLEPKSVDMDLAIRTPGGDVKQMLSLIPGAYHHYYEGITASGEANLEVTLKGPYQDNVSYPALHLTTQVKNGRIQYAGAPFPIEQLRVDAEINSRDALYNAMDVALRDLHAVVKDSPLDGQLLIDYTLQDIVARGHLKTNLDLASWVEALKLADQYPVKGILAGEADFDFSQSAVVQKKYEQIKFNGAFSGKDIAGQIPGYPAFAASNATINLNPERVDMQISEATAGHSQGSAGINIQDPLSYLTGGSRTVVAIDVNMPRLDLTEWMSSSPADTVTQVPVYQSPYQPLPPVQIRWNASIDRLDYDQYDIRNLRTNGSFKNDTLQLQTASCLLSGEPVSIAGTLRHPYQWYSDPGSGMSGDLKLEARKLDLNPWLEVDTSTTTTQTAATTSEKILPANVNIQVKASVGELIYDKYHLNNSSGIIELADQQLAFNEMKTNLLGGQVEFAGLYSEQGEHPDFDLKYDMRKMKFAPLFQTSQTFQKLAPIASFLDGVFSSTLVLSGKLGDGWMPIWDQLNAAGFLETESARLNNFEPINEVANRLQIKQLENINWKNSRNWFEVENGTVTIKPFTFDFQDMRFTVQGQHQIDQDIKYQVLLQIPRSLLAKLNLDQPVNAGVQWLQSQAQKYGVPIGQLDTAFVRVVFTGQIKKPQVQLQWVTKDGTGSVQDAVRSQFEAEVERGKDTLIQKGEEVLDKAKDTISKVIDKKSQEVIDKAQDKAQEVIDSAKNAATREARERLDSLAGKKVGEVLDTLLPPGLDSLGGAKTKEEIDKLKNILKGWDPLKKKKKSGSGNE
ncbi:MAG: AsmA family protein [Saprospiraceae bacterium]|nr:AsmA family protein [Saprospiraceae bacterium]MCB9319649.1 AsmA family protein [Lewinellaceae bacterium]